MRKINALCNKLRRQGKDVYVTASGCSGFGRCLFYRVYIRVGQDIFPLPYEGKGFSGVQRCVDYLSTLL